MSKLNLFIQKTASFFVILLTIIGVLNAVLRYVGKYLKISLSSNVMIELQWYIFSLVFLLGISYTFSINKHIRVDFFYSRFNSRKQMINDLAGNIVLLIPFCLLFVFYSWKYFENSFILKEVSSEVNGLPRYFIKFFIPLGFALLLANAIYFSIKIIKKMKK